MSTIDQALIDPHAIDIVHTLKQAGYDAFLVGGCVRDLLLDHRPKDFDVVTSAHPEQIRELFRNSRLIGRRFRLAHVYFGRNIIEVATFRGHQTEEHKHHTDESGMLLRDNIYGNYEEDAIRRDFTINALYYDPETDMITDSVDGISDINQRCLRIIGEPETRYREDPVRMLRGVRIATKLGFDIHPDTLAPIKKLGTLLESISAARLFEETSKLFHCGAAWKTYQALQELQLFEILFPATQADYQANPEHEKLLEATLKNTDERLKVGKSVTPAFVFATLLWHTMIAHAEQLKQEEGLTQFDALETAAEIVLRQQHKHTSMPRRISTMVKEIWLLQFRLPRREGRRSLRLLQHPRFRAAYDFLLLRAQAGEANQALVDWWTEFQTLTVDEQEALLKKQSQKSPRRRKPKKT